MIIEQNENLNNFPSVKLKNIYRDIFATHF